MTVYSIPNPGAAVDGRDKPGHDGSVGIADARCDWAPSLAAQRVVRQVPSISRIFAVSVLCRK